MSALRRTYLLVTLLFVVVTSFALLLMTRQAREDVLREVQAAESVVGYLYDSVQRDPENLQPSLIGNLRHIRVHWQGDDQDDDESSFEAWVSQYIFDIHTKPRVIDMPDGRRLHISVDPTDEIEEVCDSLLQLLWLSLFALSFSLLSIRWAVKQGLSVLDELLRGLQQVSEGQLDARLPVHSVPEARRLAAHFNSMATTLQKVQADNTELTHALMALQERERARLGQTLHDDLGQYLSGIRAQVCLLRAVSDNPEQVRCTAQQLEVHTQRLQEGFRGLVRDLYPVMLEHLELDEALQLLSNNWQEATGIHCRVIVGQNLPRLPLPTKAHLYRLIQEALTNVARHSHASEVRVRLQYQGKRLRLFIRDNGQGANQPLQPGIGLRSMQERARSLGAQLQVITRPGAGWVLALTLLVEEHVG
ncbi:histidine kinase [Ectopseudomonas mendocina]|uniref:histidine kinase n=1 Tax=Ectopseudomonas mendocina TaxID=300 RepID=A0ABZ2RAZ7_ECTME